MKVAYYSPMPPSRSGIADYSALLLPELEKRIDVVLARPGRFRRDPQADIALFHVGNDAEAHGWIVEALRRNGVGARLKSGTDPGPAVVVLHDFVLHHLVVGLTFARGDAAGYLAAMEREDGLVGRLLAYAVLDNKLPPLWETRPEDFPLAGEVLDHATSLIVHSRYVERRAREAGFSGPIARIPHPAWPLPELEPAAVQGDPLYGCFGHLNETKRIAELVAAFQRLRERRPGARLLLVGSLAVRLDRLELPEGVEHRDYVPEDELWSLMAACDAIVSLRSPTMGETSGSAIRALSLGKPLVVSDVGWFSELPADAVIKVPVDDGEEDTLRAALEALADPAVRAMMGERARELVEREHRVDRVAEAYAAALETFAGGSVVQERVLHEVASAAAEVGMDADDAAVLAARLREVGLGD
jgi:glycosyltransferase involved in cell wall biosynthesis